MGGQQLINFIATVAGMIALGLILLAFAWLFSWWVAWTLGEDATGDRSETLGRGGSQTAARRNHATHTRHFSHPEHDGGADT